MVSTDNRRRAQNPLFGILAMVLVLGTAIAPADSFSTIRAATSGRTTRTASREGSKDSTRADESHSTLHSILKSQDGSGPDRRDVLLAGATTLLSVATTWTSAARPAAAAATSTGETYEGLPMVKTESGLKYVELEVGKMDRSNRTPQYGQLCVISYTGYLQLPKDNKRQKFASQSGFVLKHGNGKLIAGLDEGLHTMKRGGLRRLIIPPKLGFVATGLGPLPELPWQRDSLNRLLAEMVEQRGGNLVYDVKLERFFDDEADQGYYQDDEISPEEFAELNRRLNRGRDGGALDAVGTDIELADRDREKPIV